MLSDDTFRITEAHDQEDIVADQLDLFHGVTAQTELVTLFPTVVIDPWWARGDGRPRRTRGATPRYQRMTVGELLQLRPQDIAAQNAHCYLWPRAVFLPQAHELMRAWEFPMQSEREDGDPCLVDAERAASDQRRGRVLMPRGPREGAP